MPIITQMPKPNSYSHVIIHGVGLIGGSVAAGVRKLWPNCRVTGIGRSAARLELAQQAGLLTDFANSTTEIDVVPNAIAVVCLPVDFIAPAVIQIAESTPDSILITDAGSVKESIQTAVAQSGKALSRFVGAHPIAGSEKGGFEHAEATLFNGRPCIVTTSDAGPVFEMRCRNFWSDPGATISVLTPAEHDRILAVTSHLPHVLAAVAASCLVDADRPYIGTGFRDTTRVASGDPTLWRQILTSNREQVLNAVRKAEQSLAQLASDLENANDDSVERFLSHAAKIRQGISRY